MPKSGKRVAYCKSELILSGVRVEGAGRCSEAPPLLLRVHEHLAGQALAASIRVLLEWVSHHVQFHLKVVCILPLAQVFHRRPPCRWLISHRLDGQLALLGRLACWPDVADFGLQNLDLVCFILQRNCSAG